MSAAIPEDLLERYRRCCDPDDDAYSAWECTLIERIATLTEEAAQQEEAYEAQWKKFEGCPHAFGGGSEHLCACSFDRPDDECAVHAPKLRDALTQNRQLREVSSTVLNLLSCIESALLVNRRLNALNEIEAVQSALCAALAATEAKP